jgi:hypothetical protein
MAVKKPNRAAEVVFEGVVIPKGTRSERLAKQGITTTEEMSTFLTAIFADTLNGKIVLPAPESPNRMSSRMFRGVEQKLSGGIPMKIQPPTTKRKRKPKTQPDKLQ